MIYLNPKDRLIKESRLEEAKDKYTVKELKAMAKDKGIPNYWNMKEEKLIEVLGL